MDSTYDKDDPHSIDRYTEKLIGRTLREFTGPSVEIVGKGRGDLGTMVEKYFYRHTPPNTHEPDFAEAGLELKVTGLKKLRNGSLTPKERLVLGMINYFEVVNETFEESYIRRKIRLMLVVFYLYQKDRSYLDMTFLAKNLWMMSEEDLVLIARDWITIVTKIMAGKAHELSEADTMYLSACTKAATSKVLTKQPFSSELAKPRAFALKAKYMRVVMEETLKSARDFSDLLDVKTVRETTLEDYVTNRLQEYIGKDVDELLTLYAPDISKRNKSRYAILTNHLLGVKTSKITEFEKAGVIVRTLRVNKDGMPDQSISFPHFDFMEIADQYWDDSDFKEVVESKFLFIVLMKTEKGLIFSGGKFWAMPYKDRLEAERVWTETVNRIRAGKADNLPKTDFSKIAHVRPHGQNSGDKLPAPGGLMITKQCFWLNASYIKHVLLSY